MKGPGGRRPGSRRLRVVSLAVLAAWIVATLVFANLRRPSTTALPTDVERVVVFGIPGLTIDDVSSTSMPNLAALASQGAVAAANIRGGGTTPTVAEAYVTLGAGYRISSGTAGSHATDTTTGGAPAVVVTDMPGEPGSSDDSEAGRPGALAAALAEVGRPDAVVTNADVLVDGRRDRAAPAAAGAADPVGSVTFGTVGADLGVPDDAAPGGLTTPRGVFGDAVASALRDASFLVVDPGVTTRLQRSGELGGPTPTAAMWRQALRDTDGFLGDVARRLGPHDVLIVAGVTPPGSTWQLGPVVVTGAEVPAGHLWSPSTNRRDLVTLTDIAPTVLTLSGVAVPRSMSGHALSVRPGGTGLARIGRFDDMLVSRRSTDQPLTLVFILTQSALYAAGVVLLVRGGLRSRFGSALVFGVLTCAAWPVATFWVRASLRASSSGLVTGLLTWAIAAVVAAVALRFRRHALDPLLAVCGVTVATIVADLSTGAHLQYGSFFGYAPNKGTRFVGLGNAAFALLGAATIVVCAALVARARTRVPDTGVARGHADAWWTGALVAVVVVVADGAPWMGADVGGILTLVPVLGLLLWALSGRPIRWRTVGVAVAAAVVALAVAVGLDALREPDQRTHLSRFFLDVSDRSMVRSVVADKWSANVRILRESVWAWLVPITVALSLVALTIGRLWQRALPPGSPQRHGVVATLAFALLGWLSNDSGIVVVALASVYVGPFVLLLARGNVPVAEEVA